MRISHTRIPSTRLADSLERDVHNTLEPSQPSWPSVGTSDSEWKVDDPGAGFDFALVPPLVRAIKEALKWEEPVESPSKQR